MPVMGFSSREKDFLWRKQILSFAQKVEFLGYNSLSVNDHIVFRTSWLDTISTLSAVAAITNKIKLGTCILNIVIRNPVVCAKALSAIYVAFLIKSKSFTATDIIFLYFSIAKTTFPAFVYHYLF